MELESGSPSVERCGSRSRRRASDGGAHLGGGACASECRCGVLERRIDTHLSRDVDDHIVEDADADGSRCSRAVETPCGGREVEC
jgi:hypothetical protein